MRISSLFCTALLLGLALSQAAPQKPSGRGDDDEKEQLPASAAAIAPDAPVLTIKGVCDAKDAAKSDSARCQTVVTREQFEILAKAVHANVTVQKRQFSISYPRLMAMAQEAERQGLDQNKHFQQMYAFSRMQLLSQELLRKFQDEAAQISEKEIQDYYTANAASFERATLEKITVPDIRQMDASSLDAGKGAPGEGAAQAGKDKAEMRQEAEKLRAEAVSGGDFAALQKKAYEFARLSTPPPPTRLENSRRTGLAEDHQPAFDLKPGEVSPVIADAGGFYIYKLVSKQSEPLEEARPEIHRKLEEQHMRALMEKVQDSVTTDVNQAYFGAAGEMHGKRGNKAKPAVVNQGQPDSGNSDPQ
ncbi:MAG TPA: peptidylprolyl isomerase [Candidatus Binatia bacterium]|nr:peptidylprolyl isomerase [Candidatus Binatia bacterium]